MVLSLPFVSVMVYLNVPAWSTVMLSKVIEPSFLFLVVPTTLSFESFATNSKSSPLSSPPSNAFLRFKVTLAFETFGLF